MLDAEPLLLVDDDKAEILELDLGVEQLVGADDDVDATRLQSLDGLVDLLGRLEAAHGRNGDREALVPFGERLVMLLHEQRSRHEDGHLLAVLYGLERCSHGDLGLAEATSPQMRRSIGTGFSMSDLTSSMVVSWSVVS